MGYSDSVFSRGGSLLSSIYADAHARYIDAVIVSKAFNYVAQNVHFNGPRAGVNFNDWMGGGDVLEGNLLANCVRESGDHGKKCCMMHAARCTAL